MRSITSLFRDVEHGPGVKQQIYQWCLLIAIRVGLSEMETWGSPGGSVVNDSRATRETQV